MEYLSTVSIQYVSAQKNPKDSSLFEVTFYLQLLKTIFTFLTQFLSRYTRAIKIHDLSEIEILPYLVYPIAEYWLAISFLRNSRYIKPILALFSSVYKTEMKLLIFIIAVVHTQGFNSHRFFRTRLSRQPNVLNEHENISNNRLQSMKSLNYQHLNNKCNQPCQRQPYFVTFDSIMEYAHIHKLGGSIRPGDGQYMVDIGICSGFCKKFQTFIYTDIPVSPTNFRSTPSY